VIYFCAVLYHYNGVAVLVDYCYCICFKGHLSFQTDDNCSRSYFLVLFDLVTKYEYKLEIDSTVARTVFFIRCAAL